MQYTGKERSAISKGRAPSGRRKPGMGISWLFVLPFLLTSLIGPGAMVTAQDGGLQITLCSGATISAEDGSDDAGVRLCIWSLHGQSAQLVSHFRLTAPFIGPLAGNARFWHASLTGMDIADGRFARGPPLG